MPHTVQCPIQKHIDDFRQLRRMQAGSLLISAFGDAVLARGGRIGLGSLITLLAPLALNDRLIRTAIFRLVKAEWLCAETVGRRADYLLTPAGQRRFEASARHIYAASAPLWDRRWRLIFTVGEQDAKARERLRRAFFWQGFGTFGADCFVHPSADLNTVWDALHTDGLGDLAPHLMPMLGADAGLGASAKDADLVKRAWNLDKLANAYLDFVACYSPLLEKLGHGAATDLDNESAFLLRTLLIHDYRRLLLRDPELPEVLLPAQWPGQAARKLCKDIYGCLLVASERHLDQHLKLANGSTPKALPVLVERFQAPKLRA